MKQVYLTLPNIIYKESYLEFVKESTEDIKKTGFEFCIPILDNNNFQTGIKNLMDMSKGINLPKGWVPARVYWLIDNEEKIKGIILIRPTLNESLIFRGGNISYYIRPSERQKGYATKMLSLALEECRKLSIKKVLVTCLTKNINSAKTIKANGGVLDSEDVMNGDQFQRYYIDIDRNNM